MAGGRTTRAIVRGPLRLAERQGRGDHLAVDAQDVTLSYAELDARANQLAVRPDDHRGVGNPAGDDDVGAVIEAVDDAPSAQIGVRRQGRAEP